MTDRNIDVGKDFGAIRHAREQSERYYHRRRRSTDRRTNWVDWACFCVVLVLIVQALT